MKFLAAILLFVITFFWIQPVVAGSTKKECTKCCPQRDNNKNECPKSCNPFAMCIYCQYVITKSVEIKNQSSFVFEKQDIFFNSVILSGYTTSCWHPPNAYPV